MKLINILFSLLAGRSERLLAVKVDGVSKEFCLWGFRIGFITFGAAAAKTEDVKTIYSVLEEKSKGLVRATVSNVSNPLQHIVLHMISSNDVLSLREQAVSLLKKRYKILKNVIEEHSHMQDLIRPYPFNSAYFVTFKIFSPNVNAYKLREELIHRNIGLIANEKDEIRIAYSGIDDKDISYAISTLYDVVKEMSTS